MILKDFLPSALVRSIVKLYRIVHFQFEKADDPPFKAYMPHPEETLQFMLRDPEEIQLPGSLRISCPSDIVLMGQMTTLVNRYAGKHFLNFQIVFQPAGLHKLTGIPSCELTNRYIDASVIFPPLIKTVQQRLQSTPTYESMLPIAEEFILTLAKRVPDKSHLLDNVSRCMFQVGANVSLDWLARQSCLSTKQFYRKFNERVGINPKTYLRIIRLNHAFNLKNAYPHYTWLRVAMECNYHDYQHLVKDYKDFTGLTPCAFHRFKDGSPERRLQLTDEIYKSRLNFQNNYLE